jgi:Fe-S-cluster containining protein
MSLVFKCLKCGRCCHEIPESEEKAYKRIPLFPEEADKMEGLAKERNIELHLIEDLVFPDIKNKKIIVLTWRILLDDHGGCCPFYSKTQGCIIHENKPLACQAYPLAVKTEDAFNMRIDIDPLCEFTVNHYDNLKSILFDKFLQIYQIEFDLAKKLLKRNKLAIMNLLGKEKIGEIEIPRKIAPEDYNIFLNEWEREILT